MTSTFTLRDSITFGFRFASGYVTVMIGVSPTEYSDLSKAVGSTFRPSTSAGIKKRLTTRSEIAKIMLYRNTRLNLPILLKSVLILTIHASR